MDTSVASHADTETSRRRLVFRLADLPKLVIAALLLLAIGNLLVGVFLRYVVVEITDYFDWPTVSFFWVEEVGEFALAWLTLIGAAVGIAERSHFTLTVLTHWLPARAQRHVHRVNCLLLAAFGLFAAYQGWRLCVLNSTLTSPGLEINLAWLYFSAVVGGVLISLYALGAAFGPARQSEGGH
jgi:TRAP-type C4-dicarboxylate transport system permease small subunit